MALLPAAALAARSERSHGPASRSSSILLGHSKHYSSSFHTSVIHIPPPIISLPSYGNSLFGRRSFVWTGAGFHGVLIGRGTSPDPAIPEPGAALLFGIGAALVALHLRRRPLATA